MWKRAVTIGNPPSARDSHSCSSWKNKLVVIGGEDGHDYYLSDVHILDTGEKASSIHVLLTLRVYVFYRKVNVGRFLTFRYTHMERAEYFRAVVDTSSWSCYCFTWEEHFCVWRVYGCSESLR